MSFGNGNGRAQRSELPEQALRRMERQWTQALAAQAEADRSEGTPLPTAWHEDMSRMTAEHDRLREDGLWLGGPRTLMEALDVHYREVKLTSAVGWLLRPDGHHGLGSAFAEAVLEMLGLLREGAAGARVVTEERRRRPDDRDVTQADLILRTDRTTVLFEAKVDAPDQDRQCDRLADLWSDEAAELVYLTRDGHAPSSAAESRGRWHLVTWAQLADLAEAACLHGRPAPGVHDLIATIRHHHPGRATR